MHATDMQELEALGLEAARQVAGRDAVERVQVETALDSLNRPAYEFFVLLDPGRAQQRLGLIRTRFLQKLADALDARNDQHQPMLRLLSRDDWARRRGA